MGKIIRITGCKWCPFSRVWFLDVGVRQYVCVHGIESMKIEDCTRVPNECPLENED